MAFYSVTYNLDPRNSRTNFKKNISTASNGKFIETMSFQYHIKSHLDASEMMDILCNQLIGENKILILKIDTSDWCFINLDEKITDWIQSAMSAD